RAAGMVRARAHPTWPSGGGDHAALHRGVRIPMSNRKTGAIGLLALHAAPCCKPFRTGVCNESAGRHTKPAAPPDPKLMTQLLARCSLCISEIGRASCRESVDLGGRCDRQKSID